MLAKLENGKKCIYCPERASVMGHAILGFAVEWGETKIDIPYVWAGTTSSKKLELLGNSLEILERTHGDKIVDFGHVMPIVDEMRTHVPDENDYITGAVVAEEKARAYWEMVNEFGGTQVCRRYNNCADRQLLIVNDVCGFVGIAGGEFSQTLLKPPEEVKTKDDLVDYIMKPYVKLAGQGGAQVVNRIEAAVAMLRPIGEKWEKERVISGVSRAYVGFPIEPMLDREFVRGYVEYAIDQTDEQAIMGAAGGLMHEYLVHQLQESGYDVNESMPDDDRLSDGSDLLLAHARGFPPRLLWKIIKKMYSEACGVNGKVVIMEPGD